MNYFRIKMDREKIFNTFFKHDNKGEQKFNGFSQLTPVGKRVTYLIGLIPNNTLGTWWK